MKGKGWKHGLVQVSWFCWFDCKHGLRAMDHDLVVIRPRLRKGVPHARQNTSSSQSMETAAE